MENYVSVRVERINASKHRGERNHDLRLGRIPNYVDQERSAENSVLLPNKTVAVMKKRAADLRAAAGQTPRKLNIVAVRGIVTFSAEAQPIIAALTTVQQDAYFMKAAEAADHHFNADLASLVVHRDESAIHAHFTLTAVARDGQPLSYDMGKGRLSALQDAIGEVFEPLGITRGKKLAERIRNDEPRSKTVHRSVRELHRDLPIELATAREQVRRAAARFEQTEALIEKRIAQGNQAIEKQQEKLDRQEKLAADLEALEVRVKQKEFELLEFKEFEDWLARKRLNASQEASGPRPD